LKIQFKAEMMVLLNYLQVMVLRWEFFAGIVEKIVFQQKSLSGILVASPDIAQKYMI